MKRKLGAQKAVTATAHKLARIIYHVLNTREAYNETVFAKWEESANQQAEVRLRKQADKLGFQVLPKVAGNEADPVQEESKYRYQSLRSWTSRSAVEFELTAGI